jgi:N-acetylmuramoyl-L-alanine amidase
MGLNRPDLTDPVSALAALSAPPPGVASAVPAGTKVEAFSRAGAGAAVQFSTDILNGGLDDARLETIFDQVRVTLMQFGVEGSVRLESGGRPLSDYLPPKPLIVPQPALPSAAGQVGIETAGLSGKSISLSPGHGKVWTGSSYAFERPVYCSPLTREDDHNLEIMTYLNTYLTQDGAVTKVYRCLNKSYGTHTGSGEPWWRISAGYWLKQNGYPCSVYASSTGDCNLGTGSDESADSLRSRGLASDYDGTDIYVSLHSNGASGDCAGSSCPNGTCTYYDTSSEHATWGAISQTLATDINSSIIDSIRNRYGDSTWRDRGAIDANGGQAETRIPNRAAVLIELAFHDSCDRDAAYLRDNFFRSTCMWAAYQGICTYFGRTPTWDYYSDELVSHDFPATMAPGATATVHVTFRNRGVLWNDARLFRLGAVGDSDPFTTTTRYNVGTEVGPNTTKTFTLTLTAPATPGTYTSDWRMVRDGVTWFGATLTASIVVTPTSGAPAITAQPASRTVNPGGTTSFTVTATGSAPLSYQWRDNDANLSNGGNLSGVNAATLTITNAQQTNAGTYTVLVSNTNGSVLSAEAVLTVGIPGTTVSAYTINTGNMESTSRSSAYVLSNWCGLNCWFSYGVPGPAGSNCTVFNRDIRWMPALPAYGFTGRGFLNASMIVPSSHATATVKFTAVDASGNDLAGPITGTINECAYSCDWITFYNGNVTVTNFGGWRSNTQDDGPPGAGGCSTSCGSFPAAYSQMNIQAARWHYINDWTCLGGYASTNVSDTANRSFAWGESGLYLYPAVDTSHGNHIAADLGLSNKTPGRVTTGDCNNANTLNFKGNASAYGNGDNMDAYGFAWVLAPAGAAPKFTLGSDDGNRLWVNGALINDTNASRGLTRDQDTTASTSLPVGWSRLLFKVHNFTGTFQGALSLRNGGNVSLNEPSVNVFDLGGYYSYGIGYEQDAWYPLVYVANFCGSDNPSPGANIYTNTTTVKASGTAVASGPVPFWRVMHFEWGYGLGGDTDYATVDTSGANWSHTQTGVTGHRRFHFFAVSKSGRTSFQNSGQTGGWNWAGNGAGNYADVYVDNAPPQAPAFAAAAAVSPSRIDLAWAIPMDEGVGIGPGAAEAADETSNSSDNYYRVGDVGVAVYREGSIISDWGTSTGVSDTGLAPNSPYTYEIAARDNNTEARGHWHNISDSPAPQVVWTLSVPPGAGSVAPDQAAVPVGSNVTWTAVGGFGPGLVQYYRYAWATSPTHSWTDTETQWTSGSIVTVPVSGGNWYLHVKGYNGAGVGNGSYAYSVTATAPPASALALVSSQNPSVQGSNVTFTATVTAVPPATGTPTGDVIFLANSLPFSTNLLVGGLASASTTSLPVGTNTLAAEYAGDSLFAGSSNSLQQVIQSTMTYSQTNRVAAMVDNGDCTFTISFSGTPGAQYYVVTSAEPAGEMSGWMVLANSTNTASSSTGLWSVTVTNDAIQRFYRSAAVNPAPR